MKRIYAVLAILGFVGPYIFFVRFLSANGLDLSLFVEQLFANDISTFFAVDLLIAIITFWIFAAVESRRRPIKYWWICVPATLLVGLSFGLPLFLYLRESSVARQIQEKTSDKSPG
jgi:hypothetical protein